MAARPSPAGAARRLSAPHGLQTGGSVPSRLTPSRSLCDVLGRYIVPGVLCDAYRHDAIRVTIGRHVARCGQRPSPWAIAPPPAPTPLPVSGSQKVISMDWYIAIAVDNAAWACSCCPLCSVKRAQAAVAVGLKRAHPQLLDQGEGLAVMGGSLAAPGDVQAVDDGLESYGKMALVRASHVALPEHTDCCTRPMTPDERSMPGMDSRRVAPGRQTPSCSRPGALVRWHLLRQLWERVHQAARQAIGRRALGGMLAAVVGLLGQPGFPAHTCQSGEPPAQLEPVVVTATRTATPVQATGALVTSAPGRTRSARPR